MQLFDTFFIADQTFFESLDVFANIPELLFRSRFRRIVGDSDSRGDEQQQWKKKTGVQYRAARMDQVLAQQPGQAVTRGDGGRFLIFQHDQ